MTQPRHDAIPARAPARLAVFALLFASGACGLVYQVVWTRMMTLVFGVSVYAVSTVLCSFMAGLALGSWFFGRLADRTRRPLALYGGLEIGVGLFALVFPLIMRGVEPLFVLIYRDFYVNYHLFSLVRFGVIFLVLLFPTFLMGGTFPIVMRWLVRGRGSMGRDVGTLYAVNTAGAVAGTVVVGFVLLATVGMRASILLAAAVNIAVGVAAVVWGRKGESADLEPKGEATTAGESESAFDAPLAAGASTLVLLSAGVSGFASLGLEILWTRLLVFHTHNSTYAFSAMLAVFLLGIALGSWVFGRVAPIIRRPLAWLAVAYALVGAWSAGSLLVASHLPALAQWLAGQLASNDWKEAILLIFAQAAAMLFPPTLLMGFAFPLAARLVTHGTEGVGRRLGDIYAINTLGTVLGSFVVGFILIPWIGVRNSTLVLATLYVLAGGAILAAGSPGRMALAALGGAIFAVVAQLCVPERVVAKAFSDQLGDVKFYKEEVTDTIMVIDLKGDSGVPSKEFRTLVFADGRGTAGHWTVMEDRFYGHLPMLLHPDPKDVLVICVGAGNTIGAIRQHQRLERLDCVELSEGVAEATRQFETNTGPFVPPLDPRIHLHVEDGRNYLLGTDRQYDIIHLDPPELHTAGVVFLYTEEFYKLCKARLKPGGIMSHWFNATKMSDEELRQIVGTFKKVFPHGTIWQGPGLYSWNLIASDRPLRIPMHEAGLVLAAEPRVAENLREVNLADPALLFSYLLMNETTLGNYTAGARTITDDRTIIDFSNPKKGTSGFGFANILSATRTLMRESMAGYENLARLTEKTDSPVGMIDWAGLDETQRKDLETRMGANIEARKALMRRYLPKEGARP